LSGSLQAVKCQAASSASSVIVKPIVIG